MEAARGVRRTVHGVLHLRPRPAEGRLRLFFRAAEGDPRGSYGCTALIEDFPGQARCCGQPDWPQLVHASSVSRHLDIQPESARTWVAHMQSVP